MSSKKSIKLGLLAKKIGAKFEGDADKEVLGINTLQDAGSKEIAFLTRSSFAKELESPKAAPVIISPDNKELAPCSIIEVKDPYLLYAKATQIFKKLNQNKNNIKNSDYLDLASSAKVHESANIGPFCRIGEGVVIEEGVSIGSNVDVAESSKIGKKTIIYPNCSVYEDVSVGQECIIHSGVTLGSDGLGFAKENDNWVKIEHLGRVIIGDRVEIGSNSSIDRGSVGSTKIGNDVKIDNLVHIAHNVSIGSGTAIAANSAIAGSTIVGKNCTIAGCCGVVDNIKIVDSVHITAMTLVTKSIKESGTYSSGTPLMHNKEWRKSAVAFKRLKDFNSSPK